MNPSGSVTRQSCAGGPPTTMRTPLDNADTAQET